MGEAVIEIGFATGAAVKERWTEAERFIRYALQESKGEFDGLDIFVRALSGKMQFWYIHLNKDLIAVASTEIVDYPHVAALRVVTLSGDRMHLWSGELDKSLMEYARQHHLSRIELLGRAGFKKALASLGFEQTYVCLTKEVSNGQRNGNNSRSK